MQLTLKGLDGTVLFGTRVAATFGRWTLVKRPGTVESWRLAVVAESPHPTYGSKRPTAIRVRFPGEDGDGGRRRSHDTFWEWRAVERVHAGEYTVVGIPEIF